MDLLLRPLNLRSVDWSRKVFRGISPLAGSRFARRLHEPIIDHGRLIENLLKTLADLSTFDDLVDDRFGTRVVTYEVVQIGLVPPDDVMEVANGVIREVQSVGCGPDQCKLAEDRLKH